MDESKCLGVDCMGVGGRQSSGRPLYIEPSGLIRVPRLADASVSILSTPSSLCCHCLTESSVHSILMDDQDRIQVISAVGRTRSQMLDEAGISHAHDACCNSGGSHQYMVSTWITPRDHWDLLHTLGRRGSWRTTRSLGSAEATATASHTPRPADITPE